MATTPDKDINKLIADLKAGPKKRPPPARQRGTRPYLYLVMAVGGTLVLGIVFMVFLSFVPRTPEPPAPTVYAQPHPAERGMVQNLVPIGGSAAMAPAGPPPPPGLRAPTSALRPANFLADLAAQGRLPKWVNRDELVLPHGKPLVVYVLFYAMLDNYTDQLWRRAGMFSHGAASLSPYLRQVTISDPDAMGCLTDWHVESVALEMPNPPPPPDDNEP